MMRRYGVFLLLGGLTGCISFTAQPQADKKGAENQPASASLISPAQGWTARGTPQQPAAPTTLTAPSNAAWMAHPEHHQPGGSRLEAQHPPGMSPSGSHQSLTPWVTTPRPANAAAAREASALASATTSASSYPTFPVMQPSPMPAVPTSQPIPPARGPVAASGYAAPAQPIPSTSVQPPTGVTQLGSVTAPAGPAILPAIAQRSEIAEKQVSFSTPSSAEDNIRAEASKITPPATTPVPAVKNSRPAEARPAKSGAPLVRLINSRRITLNFEVKDVGPSGLSCVELWYTQDSRDWKKYDAPTQTQSYVIEVDEEGMYGFTLLGRSGVGLSKEPPSSGDQPQLWVVVDLTKPDLQLVEVAPQMSTKAQQMCIRWKANDKNFGRTPISLYYAEKEDGPWKPIASNLENTGKYIWTMPTGLARVYLKAEATDLAGNSSTVQTPKPVLLDDKLPTVSIVGVEANASK